jgi:hypothetical protein
MFWPFSITPANHGGILSRIGAGGPGRENSRRRGAVGGTELNLIPPRCPQNVTEAGTRGHPLDWHQVLMNNPASAPSDISINWGRWFATPVCMDEELTLISD